MEYNKKSLLSFIALVLFLFYGITATNAQSPQQIAKKALASTVLLVMEDANGQPLSLGSGFFVRNGQVATNLHVVKGASRGYAKLVDQKTKYDIEGITAVDAARDLVILKISVPGTQVIPLSDSDTVQVWLVILKISPVYAVFKLARLFTPWATHGDWKERSHKELSVASEKLEQTRFSNSLLRSLRGVVVAPC